MVIVDANVLLYAVNPQSRQHEAAHAWLVGALAGNEAVGFAWTVLLAFLRLATNPSVFAHPLSPEEAAGLVELWLAPRAAVVVEPTARHLAVLRGLLRSSGTAGNLIADAHLAALALETGATVVSFDRDFARFEGLRSHVPAE